MAADVGQGSWRPGTGRASGDVRSGEQVLKITKHLPNSKPCPTALFVFSPKAVLERSVIPPPPPRHNERHRRMVVEAETRTSGDSKATKDCLSLQQLRAIFDFRGAGSLHF